MNKQPLNVFVGSRLVGSISRSDLDEDTFLCAYRSGTPGKAAVSLTMPPRADQYDSMAGLLPIFEMNLPEGGLRERLRLQFAKAIPQFDDLDLLAIAGTSQIGRLRYSHAEEVSEEVPAEDVHSLLTHEGSEDLFVDLLERFAKYSGVSGMQPKVLLRDIGRQAKMVHRGSTHIIKSFNSEEYPELAANEMLCTAGAAKAGLATARVEMSRNRQLLVVERFDRNTDGSYLGMEDFCVLTGRRAHGRYDGSYEGVGRRIMNFVGPPHLVQAREQYALMVAYACAIENGDAHLKNFSVLYEDADSPVRLSPAYDMVCTTLYSPRDTLALTLQGSKRFPDRRKLVTFIRGITNSSERAALRIVEQSIAGARHVVEEAGKLARRDKRASRFAEGLTRCVERGIARLRAP